MTIGEFPHCCGLHSRPHRTRTGRTPVSSGMHNPCAGWPICKLCF